MIENNVLLTEEKPARRGFLRNLILAPAAALATHRLVMPAHALVAPYDPVFAAIEKHKAADTALTAMADKIGGRSNWGNVTKADLYAYEAASNSARLAARELYRTAPTTREGAKALLEYVDESCHHIGYTGELAKTLLKSVLFNA